MYGNSGRNDMPSLHFKNTPVCWDFLALMFDFFSLSSCCVVRAWHSNLFSKSKSLCRRLPCLPCINYVDLVALTSDLLTVQFLDVWHFEWGNISTTFQVKIRPMCRRLSVVAQRCDANLFRKTLARYGARPLFTRSDPTDRQTDRQTDIAMRSAASYWGTPAQLPERYRPIVRYWRSPICRSNAAQCTRLVCSA